MQPEPNVLEIFNPRGLPYALLILVLMLVLSRVLTGVLQTIGERFSDKRLLIHQIGSLLRFGIYVVGILGIILSVVVLKPQVLLAVGGTLAVAVGFALKDLAASFVAGLTILADKPFQVGDRVTFDGYYGEIKHIGLRSVEMITLDDTLVSIPNSKFLTDTVASGNAGAVEMMIAVDFYIGIDQDLPLAKRIVKEALTASRYTHLKKPWSVVVKQVIHENYFAVRLLAKAYVLDVRFEKAFESDITERVLEGFAQAGIQPPAILHRNTLPRPEVEQQEADA